MTPLIYSTVDDGRDVVGRYFDLDSEMLAAAGFPIDIFSCDDVTSSSSSTVRNFAIVTAADISVGYIDLSFICIFPRFVNYELLDKTDAYRSHIRFHSETHWKKFLRPTC